MDTIIGRAGVGYDNIDVPAASDAGIVVSYPPNENAISTGLGPVTALRTNGEIEHKETGSSAYRKGSL